MDGIDAHIEYTVFILYKAIITNNIKKLYLKKENV